MKIWVTGARGMLGSAIVRALRARGAGAELLTPTSRDLDLTDARAVRKYVDAVRPDVTIHAAGRVGGIAANVADPVGFLTENMAIGMNVIEGSHHAGVGTLINVGSSCMYPKDHADRLREEDVLSGRLEPTNEGYAIAKIAADRLCEYLSAQYGAEYRTVIPSNLYGPGDHFDEQRGHLIANAIRKIEDAIRSGETSVLIWGDGSARREFTYVDDVADWIATLAFDGVSELPARVNAGVDLDYTVTEFYEHIAAVAGYQGGFEYDTSRPVGMRRKLMDSSTARTYGWAPSTELDEGLARTIDHYRSEVRPA
jgi:GDP-L-fucose synthase